MQTLNSTVASKSVRILFAQPWMPIVLILLIATVLRLHQLGLESFWQDEFYSLRDGETLKIHSPRILYFALLHLWMKVDTSDAWLRGLSVIFGVGSVFLTYQIGYRLVGRLPGLISAFMVAVSPLFIFHSQEVRMYMLSTFLTTSGTLALIHALEAPTVTAFVFWSIARLLAVITTPLNILLLLPDITLVFFRFRNQRYFFTVVMSLLLAIAFLLFPVMLNFVDNVQRFMTQASGRIPTVLEVIGQLPQATVYWPMQQIPENQLWFYGLYTLMLIFLLTSLFFNKKRSSRLNWLIAWAFLPLIAILIASYFSGFLWRPRYLLFTFPYIIILLATSLVQLWRYKRAVAIVIVLLYGITLAGGLLKYYGEKNVTDVRSLVQIISRNEKPGDIIAVQADFVRDLVFDHYYDGSSPIYVADSLRTFQQVDQATLEKELRDLPVTSRLWLYYDARPDTEYGQEHRQELQSVITQQFSVQEHQVFQGYQDVLELFLLTPISSSSIYVPKSDADHQIQPNVQARSGES